MNAKTEKADCPFCHLDQIKGVEWCASSGSLEVVRFEPLNPVTPGHMLFVPSVHITSAADDPMVFRTVAEVAAWYVRSQKIEANIITSVGAAATQTVHHMHVHVVPRREGDGLTLPWTGQER